MKPFVGEDAITERQMDMTLAVMAHSLVYWTQDLVKHGRRAEEPVRAPHHATGRGGSDARALPPRGGLDDLHHRER